MKAFERPAPLEMTLLASEENLGREAKGLPIATDLLTVSTRTDDVSCKLWPPDRRGPGRRRVRVSFLQQYVDIPSGLLKRRKRSHIVSITSYVELGVLQVHKNNWFQTSFI